MSSITYKEIDRAMRTLDVKKMTTGGKNVALESVAELISQLLQVYQAIRPLLDAFAAFAAISPVWRGGLTVFRQTVEALAMAWEEDDDAVARDFKAGKDL